MHSSSHRFDTISSIMSSDTSPVRVRFAPSPTGLLHIGGLRSALFNWLYARHTGGTFVLRLEDTDRARLVDGSAAQIAESLAWLGLTPDEGPDQAGSHGPYVQSQRLDIYRQHADKLLDAGYLYRSWETPEQLESARQEAAAGKQPYRYRREQFNQDGDINLPHVLRFDVRKAAQGLTAITWDDPARGQLSFGPHEQDDFVAVKSDGYPTYHFASVVDDHLMAISHVLRGDEWIPSTPKHLLLYRAFGWEPPVFAHLPVILGPDGKKKLSKRDADVDTLAYERKGYLPEAVLNFLASLGFNDGSTQELFSRKELINIFDLGRIQRSPAAFDTQRLDWLNGAYIRGLSLDELLPRCDRFWPASAHTATTAYKQRVLGLVQERLKYLAELPELTDFFFQDPEVGGEQVALLTKRSQDAKTILQAACTQLENLEFDEPALEEGLRDLAEQSGHKTGVLFGLIRIAITGQAAAPGLFETLATLGKEASLRRMQRAIDAL